SRCPGGGKLQQRTLYFMAELLHVGKRALLDGRFNVLEQRRILVREQLHQFAQQFKISIYSFPECSGIKTLSFQIVKTRIIRPHRTKKWLPRGGWYVVLFRFQRLASLLITILLSKVFVRGSAL